MSIPSLEHHCGSWIIVSRLSGIKLNSKHEARTISAIAQRAVAIAASAGWKYEFMDADMDITACHANGNPLKLDELLAADEFNFTHDVFGIRRHLNRKTGKLEDYFSPRYSA